MKKVKNYARFFALIKGYPGDPKEVRAGIVRSFTNDRTDSIREVTPHEYRLLCERLEEINHSNPQEEVSTKQQPSPGLPKADFYKKLKDARSAVLHRMQKLGIDTFDWAEVDKFCLNPRIAGKVFRQLSLDDLKRMILKLEAIARKPRPAAPPKPDPVTDPAYYASLMNMTKNQIPN